MPVPAEKLQRIRFGVFEVDVQEAELRKHGIRIKLQDQPFQILLMLLEHAGQTITRAELRQKLWPADTFVDFDHSLNSSIKKLREALGDDSNNPRLIETLHRHGYRFIAPVDIPVLAATLKSSQMVAQEGPPAVTGKRSFQKWAASALLALGATLCLFWARSPLPPLRVVRTQELTNDGLPKGSLVTDGNRIYFNELPPGRISIAQVAASGGETVSADVDVLNAGVMDISIQKSELLAQGLDGSFWSIPIPGGSPRRLGDISGRTAVWSPDGKLLFAKGVNVASQMEESNQNDLYISEHDGSNPRKLATVPGSASDLAFSPDGTRFRFTLTNPTNWTTAIWEARADGSEIHPVFPGWGSPPSECCGRWTADGKYFIFQSSEIWAVRERTPWWIKAPREPVALTVGPLQLSSPVPSRDGKTIFAIGTHPKAELVRYDSKSGEFIPYLGGISAGDLDFSRDGQWVTYVSYPDYILWRSKTDGSERLQLTYPPMTAALAHWSPDGQRIAFAGVLPGKPWKIFVISRNGGTLETLLPDELQELDPTWSADSKTLAFGRSAWKNDESSRIALFNLESHQLSEVPGSQKICCPRWSPDGRYIVAVNTDFQNRLMLFDFKNKEWKELKTNLRLFTFGSMVWSHDSAYIYFDLNLGRDSRFFRIRVSDSKLERPLEFKNLRRLPDLFGAWESWMGLGPGDTPLFVRDVSTQEIYALDLELP